MNTMNEPYIYSMSLICSSLCWKHIFHTAFNHWSYSQSNAPL